MKLSDPPPIPAVDDCTRLVLETVPLLMHTMRQEMRRQRPAELSLPQFRTLRILQRHPDASLSQLATRLDLTLASASKLIDVLEKHGLVARAACPEDRRKIRLHLTAHGQQTLAAVEQATYLRLGELFQALDETQRAAVIQAMQALQTVLMSDEDR